MRDGAAAGVTRLLAIGWFTEGFDARDLNEARALLMSLRH